MNTQELFFDVIRERIPSNLRLVDVLSDILDISTDSVYRRIRGDKAISLDELCTICCHFKVSIDTILNINTDQTIFSYVPLNLKSLENYNTYIKNLVSKIKALSISENPNILFVAQDIPIFHFLPFIDLTLFKVYVLINGMSNTDLSFSKFKESLDLENLKSHYTEMFDSYQKIDSVEIWTIQTIDPTIRLIEYYYDMGAFDDTEIPLLLCHQLGLLVDQVMQYSEVSSKNKSDFKLYLSPIDLDNSFLFMRNKEVSSVTIKLFTISSISSSSSTFCDETYDWIYSIIDKSILLSGSGRRERFRFFQVLKNKINILASKFEN